MTGALLGNNELTRHRALRELDRLAPLLRRPLALENWTMNEKKAEVRKPRNTGLHLPPELADRIDVWRKWALKTTYIRHSRVQAIVHLLDKYLEQWEREQDGGAK